MWHALILVVLAWSVMGLTAPAVVPMPWRYGVIHWVAGLPEHPQAYVNMATNWVEQVFSFWGLTVPGRQKGGGRPWWWRPRPGKKRWPCSKRTFLPKQFSSGGLNPANSG